MRARPYSSPWWRRHENSFANHLRRIARLYLVTLALRALRRCLSQDRTDKRVRLALIILDTWMGDELDAVRDRIERLRTVP